MVSYTIFSSIEEPSPRKPGGNISSNFLQSPGWGGSLVRMWCFPPVKLWFEINYKHSGRAKSRWLKQPFSGSFALGASLSPTSTDKSWNQRSKLPQAVKLLASAKPRVQRPCQNHYLQLNEKHFFLFVVTQASSAFFIWFHSVWGQKGWLDHLICLAVNCKSLHPS